MKNEPKRFEDDEEKHCSDVAIGWSGWALAYPEFGSSGR
jgi:hypothetical protein